MALDAEKFRVAKSAYDVEVEGERLEGELAALKAQLDTLEKEGVEGGRRGSESEGDEVLYVPLGYAFICFGEFADFSTPGSNYKSTARWASMFRKIPTLALSTARLSGTWPRVT